MEDNLSEETKMPGLPIPNIALQKLVKRVILIIFMHNILKNKGGIPFPKFNVGGGLLGTLDG